MTSTFDTVLLLKKKEIPKIKEDSWVCDKKYHGKLNSLNNKTIFHLITVMTVTIKHFPLILWLAKYLK